MASIQVKERDGGRFYYIVARDPAKGRNGQRWVYAGTDPAQAEIKRREVELSIAKGESLRRRGESPRFSVLSGEFLKYAQASLSPETVERYERSLTLFRDFLRDDPTTDRITPAILEAFKASRQKVRYHTLRNDFVALQSLYSWAKRLGYCETAPTDKITLRNPEKQRPPSFLTKAEAEKLLAVTAPNPVHHALVATLLMAGLRAGEACRLQWSEVDLERGRLRVHGKGGKYRTVPIGERLCGILQALSRTGSHVFLTRRGKPFNRPALRSIFLRAGELLGKDLHPHLLRHTYASWLMMACRNPAIVQQALGHSSITTTMIYAHVTLDLLADAVGRLDYKAQEKPKALPAQEVA